MKAEEAEEIVEEQVAESPEPKASESNSASNTKDVPPQQYARDLSICMAEDEMK